MTVAPNVSSFLSRLNVLHTPTLGQESAHACFEGLKALERGRAQSQVFVDACDLCCERNVLEDRVSRQRAVWIELARQFHQLSRRFLGAHK